MHSILVICGPTCSGKSALALDIAQSTRGVIINADAMQVYSELRILTARPSEEDVACVPHRLYGTIAAKENFSVGKWLLKAKEAIDETFANKMVPVITGGTGMYIKGLMEGLSPIPDISEHVREEATKLWQEQGAIALSERDSAMSERLKPGDMQRHIRSLEVLLATGKSLTYWQDIPRVKLYPDVKFEITYVKIPREELYRRCDTRFHLMMKAGALEEAITLYKLQLSNDLPAMRALGVQELFAYIEKKGSLDEAISKAQQATRNYAKRQTTWFNNQLPQ